MFIHLFLCVSLIPLDSIPDLNSCRELGNRIARVIRDFDPPPLLLDHVPDDSLRYRGPRETLNGWVEGPVIG